MNRKTYVFPFIVLMVMLWLSHWGQAQEAMHPSAIFEVRSTDKGFLPPRLPTQEISKIQTQTTSTVFPAFGLIVYDSSNHQLLLLNPKKGTNKQEGEWIIIGARDEVTLKFPIHATMAYQGTFNSGVPQLKITLKNISTKKISIDLREATLVFDGVANNLTTTSTESFDLGVNQSREVTYTVTGSVAAGFLHTHFRFASYATGIATKVPQAIGGI